MDHQFIFFILLLHGNNASINFTHLRIRAFLFFIFPVNYGDIIFLPLDLLVLNGFNSYVS